ncbi:MAG TPA: glycosyltransferase family 2 protein, partial [Holophagaceae bacterium]|nr:glycosyltransferase family 2 protein [Holophagaceae bacterium]
MLKRIARRVLAKDLDGLQRQISLMGEELDALRSRMDLGAAFAEAFQEARRQPAYEAAYADPDPLVSVCVATYNRGAKLTERCLPSLLKQTHRNLEILVVGDACTDDTEARVAALGDPRIRFENLAERGRYPEDPHRRWMVAGTVPINRALALASGRFVTHLDDDDAHAEDRIEKLLKLARATRADIV